MDTLTAVETIYKEDYSSPMEFMEAIAYMIETGEYKSEEYWRGFIGRTCQDYINSNLISNTGEIQISEEDLWKLVSE